MWSIECAKVEKNPVKYSREILVFCRSEMTSVATPGSTSQETRPVNVSAAAAVDYSGLKDPNVDCIEWINSMFETAFNNGTVKTNSEQEALATSVVMKLQLYIQEVEKHVEDIMQSVSASVPRVLRDVESLRHETMMLHNEMTQVRNEVGALCNGDSKQSMQILIDLDREHEKISEVLKFIQQADSWSTLTQQIEDCFLNEDIDGVSEKLAALTVSVDATAAPASGQSSVEFESRKSTLELLRNRAEALISSKVLESVSQENVEMFTKYRKILTQMGRPEAIFKFFYQHHKVNFQRVWSEIYSESYEETVSDLLTLVFSELQTMAEHQMEFISKVSDAAKVEKSPQTENEEQELIILEKVDTGKVVNELVTQCVRALEPSLTTVVKQSVDTLPCKDVLTALKEIHNVEKTFVENIEMLATKSSVILQAAVYTSLVPVLLNYNKHLIDQLNPVVHSFSFNGRDLHHVKNGIEDSRQILERNVNDSLKLCHKVSDSLAILNVVEVLEQRIFVSYLNKISEVIEAMSKKMGFAAESADQSKLKDPKAVSVTSSSVVAEDWSMFQNAAKLSQTVGRIRNNLLNLEKSIVQNYILCDRLLILYDEKSSLQIEVANDENHEVPFNYLKICNNPTWLRLCETIKLAKSSKDFVKLFPRSIKTVESLIGRCQQLAVNCVVEYARQQFMTMRHLKDWTKQSGDQRLPKFSLAPLEYITRVGQYIMSLPAQLEILESDAEIQEVFSRSYVGSITNANGDHKLTDEETVCEFWLSATVQELMKLYLDSFVQIEVLTDEGCRQMSADVSYFQNVLDDIGVKLSDDLAALLRLLECPANELAKLQNAVPHRLFITVKSQRR